MPNSLKEWLESIENDLNNKIKRSRRYHSYVDKIICNTEDFYIWKKSGSDSVENVGNATIIKLAPLKPISISPVQIRFNLCGDWREWYERGTYMGLLSGGTCRHFALKEERIVADTLMKNTKVFETKSETFTLDELREAIDYITSCGNFANTMLINPLQRIELRKAKGFVPYWNLAQEYVKKEGSAFVGLYGQLTVYSTTGLPKPIGLIFEKGMVKVRKTPLSIKFDDYSNPKILNLGEDIFAWSVDDGAIATITSARATAS